MNETDQWLEEVRERMARSTPGPWSCDEGPGAMSDEEREANARFIVHARTDIPRLLDLVAELRAENAAQAERIQSIGNSQGVRSR